MTRYKTLLLCMALVGIGGTWRASAQRQSERTVVLLLFDGWAPALLVDTPTPALARMREEGAWTHHMLPVFPSVSLVNQVSVSTGCWPEHHGIVTNEFLDPVRGRYDHSHDADWLTGCEHLHQVAERQGIRSAALGWVGRFSTTRGDMATYASKERAWPEFPEDPQRADEVIRYLRLPDAQRPRLILAYFKGPDGAAHFSGMESEQTRRAVIQSDAVVGAILAAIDALPFRDHVTLIVTTDHGMLPVWINVNIERILRNNDIDATAVSAGTTSFLYLRDPAKIGDAARKLSSYYQYFEMVPKLEQRADWHLGRSPRVGDIIISARPPNFIEDIGRWPILARWLERWGPEFLWSRLTLKATHGYAPKTSGMAGILYAWGAGIAHGREVVNLSAIDVHPTVCRLLGIDSGSPMDGNVATDLLSAGE